jgi:hypothetical protein
MNAANIAVRLGGRRTDLGTWQVRCPSCQRDHGVTLDDKDRGVIADPNCGCPDTKVRDGLKAQLGGRKVDLRTPREQRKREQGPNLNSEPIRTGDLWRREYEPQAYAVDNLFVQGQLIAITGKTQSGKTAFAMKLAGCKANGKAFAGHDCPKGHILYIAAENEVDALERYICMVEAESGFDESHFHVRTAKDRKAVGVILEEFERYTAALKIELSMVVVDTAPAMSPVEDELNNTEQGDYARALRRFCTLPGRPVTVALCHPNKHPHNATECLPRGGGAFLNELDGNVTLWSTEEVVEVAWTKLRQLPWQPFQFRFTPIEATETRDAKDKLLRSVTVEFIDDAERERVGHLRTTNIEKVLCAMGTATDAFFTSKRKIGEAAGLVLPGADKDHASVKASRRLVDDMMGNKAGAKPLIHSEVSGRYSLTPAGRALAKKMNGDAR